MTAPQTIARPVEVLKLAVMAVGGQGGGVLTGWIEQMARARGWHCQATSVAGVSQRTGATIYYVEMAAGDGPAPVFSLAPAAGDVDVLIAAEMMEAGRAIMRGFVTPDRTTLVASAHRMLAVSEKSVPGSGIASEEEVRAAAELAARRLVLFDMEQVAVRHGSVISASLFGALAGSGALPFERADFEAAITASGRAVTQSLAAFAAGFDGATRPEPDRKAPVVPATATGPDHLLRGWQDLHDRVEDWPEDVAGMARAGLRKLVAFQDIDYGALYLDRVEKCLDVSQGLGVSAAKYIANAMAYDDVIRVADEKVSAARFDRISRDMQAEGDVLHLTEYFHPRGPEVIGVLPVRLGRWVERRPKLTAWIDRRVNRGRRLRSDRLWSFFTLFCVAGLRRWRRGTLRHAVEDAHVERLLALALGAPDHDLGAEILACQRLIKGYSDTHTRGHSKFDKVIGAVKLVEGRPDAADWIRRLRTAALQDEKGKALDGALETVRSIA